MQSEIFEWFQPDRSHIIGCRKCSTKCWKGGGSIIARVPPALDQIALVPFGARPAPPLKSVVWQPHVKRGAADASAASTRRGSRQHGGTHEASCQCRCGPPRGRRCEGPCRRGGRSGSLKCTSPGSRGHTSRSQHPTPPDRRTRTRRRCKGCHPRLVGAPPGPQSAARGGAPWACGRALVLRARVLLVTRFVGRRRRHMNTPSAGGPYSQALSSQRAPVHIPLPLSSSRLCPRRGTLAAVPPIPLLPLSFSRPCRRRGTPTAAPAPPCYR